ncbi:class I SAM-dependent methyltransferase [Aquabacter spiritensis]|uniref:Methyltransferase family protein n=1 Tax=Aquabacter spiritensis TaxID=933073 RepID=A0A4V2UXE5_9HYPH|nr:class I SAM-dependent methyltransferase [Aquabacter spiritensis]TCT03188.1 methyltransferase family protein [Aquabacter spiritensis]
MHVYSDTGNAFVAAHIPPESRRILDIGCGSGDLARLIKQRRPAVTIEGITHNQVEADAASDVLDKVYVADIERDAAARIAPPFDCLLFSHVLEHMRDPARVLSAFLPMLEAGGAIVIAVPNVLEWRTRARFLMGDWTYADSGILDRTHLRFFTYATVEHHFDHADLRGRIEIIEKKAEGSVPLWPLRRLRSAKPLLAAIDAAGTRHFPNLFGRQILLLARKVA